MGKSQKRSNLCLRKSWGFLKDYACDHLCWDFSPFFPGAYLEIVTVSMDCKLSLDPSRP